MSGKRPRVLAGERERALRWALTSAASVPVEESDPSVADPETARGPELAPASDPAPAQASAVEALASCDVHFDARTTPMRQLMRIAP